MVEVAKATVTIIPNMQGSQKKIAEDLGASTDAAGEKAGKSFGGKLIGAVGKLGVAAAIGKFIGDSVSKGADLQQSLGGIETLFKENADVVKGYAADAYKTAGMSANDYMENVTSFSAALIKSMDGDTAAAAEMANMAITDMADNANKMGVDMSTLQTAYSGFSRGQFQMLDSLSLGYSGTKEGMQQLIADANKLRAEQGLTADLTIDSYADMVTAIHTVQENLGITGATAAEAATTFSGSMASMKAAAENLMGNLALGESIGPQIDALSSSVKTFVVDNLLPMIGNVVEQLPALIARVPQFIGDLLPGIVAGAADIVMSLAEGIVANIPTFVASIGTMFGKIWDFVETIDWSAVGSRIVNLINTAWDTLVETAQTIWDGVVGIFTGDVEFPDLSGAAQVVWDVLTTVAQTVWDAVVAIFTGAIEFLGLSDVAETAWNGITGVAQTIWDTIVGIFTGDIEFPSLDELATTAWSTLVTLAGSFWESIKGIFTKLFDFTSLDEKASAAWDTLTGIASGVWDKVKAALTAVFDFTSLDEKATAAWSTLVTLAGNFWTSIKGIFGKTDVVFEDLSSLASTAWDTLTTAAGTVWDGIKDIFGSFDIEWPDFGALAKDALDGLANAAKGVWDWVKSLFSGDEEDEAVKTVQGSTAEMASALADAKLKVSEVDLSSIIGANEFIKNSVASWKRIFENVQLKLPTIGAQALTTAYKLVTTYVGNYKAAMNFTWSLPTLHGHLPVIAVSMRSASSSDGKTTVSYPDLYVGGYRWFAKGAVFNEPTVIGIGDSKGPEAAVPLDMMWKQMGREFDKHLSGNVEVTNYITVNGAEDPAMYAETLAREIRQQLRMS